MKKKLFVAVAMASSVCFAQESLTDSITTLYEQKMSELIEAYELDAQQVAKRAETVSLSPYYFRLMTPGTYYSSAVQQMMNIDWPETGTLGKTLVPAVEAVKMSDQVLTNLYVHNPSLVTFTEAPSDETPILREELETPITVVEPKLSEMAVDVDLDTEVADTVAFVAKKPNFWKISGNGSLQFTQSYFSENWYQGGENNYAGIGMLTLEANYDNKQKIQWDNKLEAQLGFQTVTNDEHKARVTSNLLRLTSKIGYKAIKNWFYTGQLMTYTQVAPFYEKNPLKDDGSYDLKPWKARFGTPWYLTLSVGMDYKYKSKNGKVDLSVYVSPVAYYMTYVERLGALSGNPTAPDYNPRYYGDMYGINEDADGIYTSHSFHKFGPNFTINSKIQVMKNVLWTSRLYWFSNFHSTLVEWENTLDFTINKYLSAKFYAYPRFDDSSTKYRNPKKHRGDYMMFKEWLSLGVSYKF